MNLLRGGQMSFGEESLYDPVLLAALEARHGAQKAYADAAEKWQAADEGAKVLIKAMNLDPGIYRSGAFKITITEEKRTRLEIEKAQP